MSYDLGGARASSSHRSRETILYVYAGLLCVCLPREIAPNRRIFSDFFFTMELKPCRRELRITRPSKFLLSALHSMQMVMRKMTN